MRILKWLVAVVLGAALLYTCALPGDLPASVDSSDGLPGTYTANGVDPTGQEFSGTAVIAATTDPDRFDIALIITGSIQEGQAVRSGNRLTVGWETVAAASDEPLTGTGDYIIEPDGRLTGTWSVDDTSVDDTVVDGTSVTGTIELFPDP